MPAEAATLRRGFSESTVFTSQTNPTVVRFSSDGGSSSRRSAV